MKHQYTIYLILFLAICALAFSSFGLYRNQEHNEFHRSRMAQYQYLNQIRNLTENDMEKLSLEFPDMEKLEDGYILSLSSEKVSRFFEEQGVKPLDFYGYYFESNSEGMIIYAGLHKH